MQYHSNKNRVIPGEQNEYDEKSLLFKRLSQLRFDTIRERMKMFNYFHSRMVL